MKIIAIAAAAIGISLALGGPAGAQAPPYIDTHCGMWQGDTWMPNGACPNDVHRHARIAGTITFVKGHLVTVQQTGGTLVINDAPALINQMTGRVAVGRQIVAHGYWDAGTFYATIILTQALPTGR